MQQHPDTIGYQFPFAEPAVEQVFRDALMADIRAARLSPAFRAYYRVRAAVPLPLRQLLQRCRPVQATERWCFADQFIERLTEQVVVEPISPIIHPWPDGADFAFVLTHDVDTAEGLARVARIADLEQELGFRSSWNIVPYKYRVDHGLLADLQARGFEIGVHGYNHDGMLYLSKAIFEKRVAGINAALRSFGAVGFRSPMVHRNLAWLQMLDIQYDASCFDVDPYQAMPGGVGSMWPFIAGKFVELPYTLPQDHTVFIVLGGSNDGIWREKLNYLARHSGMALMLTHPDYLDSERRLDVYRDFLEYVQQVGGWWHALPREVAAWWRVRESSSMEQDSDGIWRVRGPASRRGSAARLNASGGQLRIERLANTPAAATSEPAIGCADF